MQPQKKEDVRIKKSKRDLRNALIELLRTNTFADTTVMCICEKAMVNRMTFYKHYQDKYALLDDCLDNIKDEILDACEAKLNRKIEECTLCEFTMALIEAVINTCSEYREIITSLMVEDNTLLMFIILNAIKYEVKSIVEKLCASLKPLMTVDRIASIFTGAITNVVFDWIRESKGQSKEDFIEECKGLFNRLYDHGGIFFYPKTDNK